MPNGLIDDAALRVHPDGFALALTIPWYRSLWLSSVTTIRLSVDGVPVPEEDLAFELGGVRYSIAELKEQSETLWYLQAHPLLVVRRDPAVRLGETHEIDVYGELRLPYMQIKPGDDGGPGLYVPNVVHQALTLAATDRDAEPPLLETGIAAPPAAARRTRSSSASRCTRPARSSGPYGSTSTACSTASPSSASGRASRSSPPRCCRRTPSSRTRSSRPGARRSTVTGSRRARSAPTSTWAGAATAT